MELDLGDIYRIVNLHNLKCYIGQAKHFSRHGNNADGTVKYEKRGWLVRVHEHFYRIRNNKDGSCPVLSKAVKKYGENSFLCHKLETCHVNDLDDRETWWIRIFNSYRKGYNVRPGGGAFVLDEDRVCIIRQMQWFDPNYRNSILELSESRRNYDLPSNIDEYHVRGELSGFRVRLIRKGKSFAKVFGPGYDMSLYDKLDLAVKWKNEFIELSDKLKDLPFDEMVIKLDEWNEQNYKYEIKKNPNGVKKYDVIADQGPKVMKGRKNRVNDLPTYVYKNIKNGKHIGFEVMITHNGVRYTKKFTSSSISMEQKIELCVKWRDEKLIELGKNL